MNSKAKVIGPITKQIRRVRTTREKVILARTFPSKSQATKRLSQTKAPQQSQIIKAVIMAFSLPGECDKSNSH